jgi:hypothetical protein
VVEAGQQMVCQSGKRHVRVIAGMGMGRRALAGEDEGNGKRKGNVAAEHWFPHGGTDPRRPSLAHVPAKWEPVRRSGHAQWQRNWVLPRFN